MSTARVIYHYGRRIALHYLRPLATAATTEHYGYAPRNFWDGWYHDSDLSDAETIEQGGVDSLAAATHYRALEAALCAACHRYDIDVAGMRVLDVGTGTGHWLDVWDDLGADAVGIDLSEQLVDELDRDDVFRADIREETPFDASSFDLVSGFGVFFHIVRDGPFGDALDEVARLLRPGGWLVFSGELGWLTRSRQFHDRAQDDQPAEVMKRLRSWRVWKDFLADAGFEPVGRVATPDWVDVDTPENDIGVARVRER